MITDDEVMELFKRADPARSDDVGEQAASAYLDHLQPLKRYVAEADVWSAHLGRSSEPRWRVIVAVAGVGVLIAGALVLAARRDPGVESADRTIATSEQQHTRPHAVQSSAPMVRIADAFMAARNNHDTEAALSLVTNDGVLAQLCDHGLTPRYACVVDDSEEPVMNRIPLDRAEVTLALEAEELLGVRFEDPVCEKAGGTLVTCTYRMDTRLRRIAGLPPVVAAASLGVVDGRISLVAFPWLNVGFDPGGIHPVDAEPFVQWIEEQHPEVLGNGDLLSADGSVFRAGGQELILVLTRPSLARLAAFLDEYESVGLPAADGSGDG